MNDKTNIEGFVFINNTDEDLEILCIEKDSSGPVVKLKRWGPELDNKEICLSWEPNLMKYLYSCEHYSKIELTESDIVKLSTTPAILENGTIYI